MGTQFKYTHDNNYISDLQRQFYEDNGYLIIRKLISDELLNECQQRFIDICNKKVSLSGNMTLMKDASLKNSNAKGEFLYYKLNDILHDEVLFKYASDVGLVNIVSSIIGSEITAPHSMLINKPPDSSSDDSRHPLHQDSYYFPFRPTHKIVTAWTAMERIDERNGCLFAIPVSHKGELYPHKYPDNVKNLAYHGISGFDNVPKVNFVMEKGDTVFFHPTILHGSGPNRTKGFRRAISVHYAATNCHFIDVRGTIQESIADELLALYARRGLNLVYDDIWKYKSRLISGPPGNFQRFTCNL